MLQVRRAVGTSLEQVYQTYTYGLSGEIRTVTDARGNVTSYDYDAFKALSTVSFPHKTTAGTSDPTDYEAYTYDALGSLVQKRNRAADLIDYDYDALGRETRHALRARARSDPNILS